MSPITWMLAIAGVLLNAGYVVNAIGATFLFGESISVHKLAGITVIIAGVWLLAGSHT